MSRPNPALVRKALKWFDGTLLPPLDESKLATVSAAAHAWLSEHEKPCVFRSPLSLPTRLANLSRNGGEGQRMSDLRLEDLRRRRAPGTVGEWLPVTASEVASVLSDADLLGELVRRGVLIEHVTLNGLHHRYGTEWSEPVGSGE